MIKNILSKNVISALAGYPIAFGVNLLLLPQLLHWVEWNWFLGTLALGAPYFAVSVARMTVVDFAWQKYKINIDPTFYIKKLLNRGKDSSKV